MSIPMSCTLDSEDSTGGEGIGMLHESKVAPSASISIVANPSKPSSGANARDRHSSGASSGQSIASTAKSGRKRLTIAFL